MSAAVGVPADRAVDRLRPAGVMAGGTPAGRRTCASAAAGIRARYAAAPPVTR
ncbi:hypothetical protein O7622_21570 [Micromonospora sp. WMMD1076]|uniref:hypothetical protein n=1 Tax=Micromonospora sp. WMMD1076 TaxID=3016103 RepID=UPI00249A3B25|nr:hypothetical protein [Micromonospora sp. WMMD1076]WFF05633.1 hypothetical protein O7622_21570 [Micromonospora sp. WMMD1076]